MRILKTLGAVSVCLAIPLIAVAQSPIAGSAAEIAVGPQYAGTHVYLAPADVSGFVTSFLATFGGSATRRVTTITPTPSSTFLQLVTTPVGNLSVFGFRTPIPFPFGSERGGYLVRDLDVAVRQARADGAAVLVAPFADAIGRDAVIQWPGGVNMQLFWHTTPPSSPPLRNAPENRVYVSVDSAAAFVRGFTHFSSGRVVSDEMHASGIEIGRPDDTFREVRIDSLFGPVVVLVTDGHLPYPYGREMTGYAVPDLDATLTKAEAAGAHVLVKPYRTGERRAAMIEFPGGYIAEVHTPIP
jgi:predicted enzyme related to lactoylglutathione lyase